MDIFLRRAFSLLLVAGFFSIHGPALAGSYEDLYQCFRDIPGWNAEKPTGMAAQTPGFKMINASREYMKGDNSLEVTVLIGPQAMASWMPMVEETRITTPEGEIKFSRIDGFLVQTINGKARASSSVMVQLSGGKDDSNGAMLVFTSDNVPLEKLYSMARTFDWNCFKKKAASVK